MKLRSQLVLAFLLLSVLPLTGIVLYSYVSSTEAFLRAVEAEASQLTAEIEERMGSVKAELRQRLHRVSALPGSRYALELPTGQPLPEELFRQLLVQMGEAAGWIESLEFIPGAAAAPEAPPVPASPPVPGTPAAVPAPSTPDSLGEGRPAEPSLPAVPDVTPDGTVWMNVDHGQTASGDGGGSGEVRISLLLQGKVGGEEQRRRLEEATSKIDRRIEDLERELAAQRGRVDAGTDLHTALDTALEANRIEGEIQALAQRRERMAAVLGADFSSVITEGGRVLGFLRAAVSAPQLVREVLRRTRRDKGEVPFAFDGDGNLYASSHDDLSRLEELPVSLPSLGMEGGDVVVPRGIENWMVVARKDPDSSLVFGIARPIGASLSQIRQTSVRNFGLGLGMIGLALLGILPLSGRLTRNLNRLTRDVERFAAGDLEVRTAITSSDELGQLGGAFNRMAEDLLENQERILEQERRQREQEVERRLLEAENRRKSEELEEARRFQLSLLPKRLPRHPGVEVAVFMQTATEVGGDYYDFQHDEDGVLTVAVGDATGHGARAGTMVTAIKSLFVSLAHRRDVAEFLDEATKAVKSMDLGRMSMGLVLTRLDDRHLTVAAAGMPPVLVCRQGEVEELVCEGLPLGSGLVSRYDERSTELRPGDVVLLMSDGFPELLDGSGEPLGYPRVRQLFADTAKGSARELIQGLAAAVEEWTGGATPSDDVTFVALRVRG